jgi:uncharacterized repeat protein (TIGR01451 family)
MRQLFVQRKRRLCRLRRPALLGLMFGIVLLVGWFVRGTAATEPALHLLPDHSQAIRLEPMVGTNDGSRPTTAPLPSAPSGPILPATGIVSTPAMPPATEVNQPGIPPAPPPDVATDPAAPPAPPDLPDASAPVAPPALPPPPTETQEPAAVPPAEQMSTPPTSTPLPPSSTPIPAYTPVLSPTATSLPATPTFTPMPPSPTVIPTPTRVPVIGSPIRVVKLASASVVDPGEEFRYSISLFTSDTVPVAVTLEDVLDSNLEVVRASATNGSCSAGQTVTCSLTIQDAAPAIVTIQVRVRAATPFGTVTNQARAGTGDRSATSEVISVQVNGSKPIPTGTPLPVTATATAVVPTTTPSVP